MPNDTLNVEDIDERLDSPVDEKSYKDNETLFGQAVIGRYMIDTELRNCLVQLFSIIIICWLSFVGFVLTHNRFNFCLSDSVLITLLTTTTIQVLGMMIIILKNLFPSKNINYTNIDN